MPAQKSIAQLKRCDGLIAAKIITQEIFDRDLLLTDVENIPWRVGPLKEGDIDEEFRALMIQRKADLAAGVAPAEPVRPQVTGLGEGAQDGGEGLEAGRNHG
jgi:hypothetical protein